MGQYPRWLVIGLYSFGVGFGLLAISLVFVDVIIPAWVTGPLCAVPVMLATLMWTRGVKAK